MQLIRGMTSLNTKKRKGKHKSQALLRAEAEHQAFLRKMGVKGVKTTGCRKLVVQSTVSNQPVLSDSIPGNGTKKDAQKYTGDEIAGIVTTHKSNLMPVRKDNKKAIVDAAQMRRN